MKLSFKVDGDIRAIYGTSILEGKRAVKRGVTQAGRALQQNWRGQVIGAGLRSRLSNAIRLKVYPEGRDSLKAAALVYAQPNKKPTASAAEIIDSYDKGVTIRSQNGFYLAIPLRAAGRFGTGQTKITPGGWEKRTGRKLTFIYRKGKPPLLVDTGQRLGNSLVKRRRMTNGVRSYQLSDPTTFKNKTIPIFVLKSSVRVPKKLSLANAAAAAQNSLATLIVQNWQEGPTR
jgi:hypothetical protein